MSYQLVTFEIKIGDAGVTQSSDGSGGTNITINNVNIYPPFGSTILNAFPVSDLGESGWALGPASDGHWYFTTSLDATASSYPIPTGTVAATVRAIVG